MCQTFWLAIDLRFLTGPGSLHPHQQDPLAWILIPEKLCYCYRFWWVDWLKNLPTVKGPQAAVVLCKAGREGLRGSGNTEVLDEGIWCLSGAHSPRVNAAISKRPLKQRGWQGALSSLRIRGCSVRKCWRKQELKMIEKDRRRKTGSVPEGYKQPDQEEQEMRNSESKSKTRMQEEQNQEKDV